MPTFDHEQKPQSERDKPAPADPTPSSDAVRRDPITKIVHQEYPIFNRVIAVKASLAEIQALLRANPLLALYVKLPADIEGLKTKLGQQYADVDGTSYIPLEVADNVPADVTLHTEFRPDMFFGGLLDFQEIKKLSLLELQSKIFTQSRAIDAGIKLHPDAADKIVPNLINEARAAFMVRERRESKTASSPDKMKIVVGENHEENSATTIIRRMLPEMRRRNTPLFLEFLEYEIWEPMLREYYKASDPELIAQMEKQIKFMVSKLPRETEVKNPDNNNDLFELIKEAHDQGVRVYAAETTVSMRCVKDRRDGATEDRTTVAEFTTEKIINALSPDNFVVLYGNSHLIEHEIRGVRKPPLGELLGAESIAFCEDTKIIKDLESLGADSVFTSAEDFEHKLQGLDEHKFSTLKDVFAKLLVAASPPKPSITPFRVDFLEQKGGKQVAVSSKEQAIEILGEVDRLHRLGAKTVGITYSANQAQTDKILATYAKKDQWKTDTSGANQADVIRQIEQLLATATYKHLQSVYRTVPITTMKYQGMTAVAADDASVRKSLESANQFVADGGVLLGWQNQFTRAGSLAIGGGVAAGVQTAAQKEMIQSWVKDNLASPLALPAIKNKYVYQTSNAAIGRFHFFNVSGAKFNDLKPQYKGLSGDYLKSRILDDFKDQIAKVSSNTQLAELKREFMQSAEYTVLKTGQGLFTRIVGIQTSSVKAFEKMCEDKEANIEKMGVSLK